MSDPIQGALLLDAIGEAVHQVVESPVVSESESEFESSFDSDLDSDFALTAQQQWEESINQLTSLVNYVFFPYLGKFLGRRAAHTFWRRFADWWWLQY